MGIRKKALRGKLVFLLRQLKSESEAGPVVTTEPGRVRAKCHAISPLFANFAPRFTTVATTTEVEVAEDEPEDEPLTNTANKRETLRPKDKRSTKTLGGLSFLSNIQAMKDNAEKTKKDSEKKRKTHNAGVGRAHENPTFDRSIFAQSDIHSNEGAGKPTTKSYFDTQPRPSAKPSYMNKTASHKSKIGEGEKKPPPPIGITGKAGHEGMRASPHQGPV